MSSLFEKCVHLLRHSLVIVGALVLVGAIGGLIFMYSGLFNVAATVADSRLTNWALVTVREASIVRHARDVQAPAADMVTDSDAGFVIYRRECVMCHTPVGRSPRPMAVGFNPQAPGFDDEEDVMAANEVFWVIKNGIRFTGMPAWGPSLSDEDLWNVTAFLADLPTMTAAEYDALDARIPETGVMP